MYFNTQEINLQPSAYKQSKDVNSWTPLSWFMKEQSDRYKKVR